MIDDQQENTIRFSKFFKSKGFQTTVTNDSWEGYHQIQKEQYDVILLNMYMPDFNGEQIIKMLATDEKLHYQNIFILPAPFDHNNQVKDLTKRDGINGCLEKHMNLDEILKIITQDFNLQKTQTPEIT
jgi:CheY-like chemotaxis protein